MNIATIFSLNSLTIIFALGCLIVLAGLIGIVVLIFKQETNALVSACLMAIFFGLFLITIDRILFQYIDYNQLNKAEFIITIASIILFISKKWKGNR